MKTDEIDNHFVGLYTAIFLKGSQRFKISFVVFIRKIVEKGCHSVFSPNVIGHTGRILSIYRQPEVMREYLICCTFLFRESFPHLLSVLRNLFHVTFQFFKVIDERMTVNKGTDSRS